MVDEKVDENKRRFLKALAGGIAGLSIPMSIYEVLIIPELQRRFIKELEYWMNEYKLADEKLKELQSKYETSDNTLTNLKQFENELNEQIKLYSQMKDEAINKMKDTINKYEILLGREFNFEKNAVKILEDLKIKGDKLLKSHEHLPAIVDFYWKPTKEINGKIYNINVSFEVISPLNSLKEVEVMLIPVEYRYFITKYGMREEDYDKVFPKEEIRIVKIEPKKLEEEMFSVDFKDLKGGREYIVKARVEDVAGSEKIVEVKTPYIRQFENIAKTDDITVAAFYYNWYTPGYDIPKDLPDKPLLGLYYSDDNIVFNKHIDWATGHGIDVFIFPYPYHNPKIAFTWLEKTFKKNMEADLFNQIKFSFCSTFLDETGKTPPYNFDNPETKEAFVKAIEDLISKYASLPKYWKIDGKPVIVLWGTADRFVSNQRNIEAAIKEVKEFSKSKLEVNLYIISDDINVFNTREVFNSSDAIYHYSPFFNDKTIPNSSIKENIPYIIDWMKRLEEMSRNGGKIFIPTIAPGFDNTYDYRNTQKASIIYRDPEGFRLYIKEVIKNFKPKILFITSFNEWFETTQIEPTQSYGEVYLEILKKELKNR
jgi:hypothetical protein